MIRQALFKILTASLLTASLFPFLLYAELPLSRLQLPDDFSVKLYAENIPGARSLALGQNGTVFVGTRTGGRVYALRDENHDGEAEKRILIAKGLNYPHGVAVSKSGDLYVAEIHRLLRYKNIEKHLEKIPEAEVLRADFPESRHHGFRPIRFGPDDKLYMGIGAPCNVCIPEEPRIGTIVQMNAEGKELKVFAKGIRNTVGFDWHPQNKALWFTDNGRDWLGDDLPPDELNRAVKAGLHFGFPYCHGKGFRDPKFGQNKNCKEFVPVAQALGAHVASLGMRFYTGTMFPKKYRNQIFIAEHGSWNRSTPSGYRLTVVTVKNGEAISYKPFLTGWLKNAKPWGRPVDLLVLADGSLLVSDDYAGVVYRISYDNG